MHYSSYGILYWTLLSAHVGVMSISSQVFVVFDWSNINKQLIISQSELVLIVNVCVIGTTLIYMLTCHRKVCVYVCVCVCVHVRVHERHCICICKGYK